MVIPHFELKGADLTLNDEVILNNISLKIQNHTLTRISGENGSGKSCLISILLNLYSCSSGTQISSFSKKDLCYIPSHAYFFDTERIVSCMRLFKTLYHTSLERLIEIMADLNLDYSEIKHKKYGELSSGMKQKISIIPLFLDNLHIYFLDELTQNLDSDTIQRIKERLNDLLLEQKTIVIIDHNEVFINQLESQHKEHYLCKNKTVLKL